MKIEYANLEWTDSGAPRSVEFDDIYRDAADPLGESRHVFLKANRIARRMVGHDGDFVVAEAGFGSGINFLLTVDAWLAAGRPCRLHYLGFEHRPLRPEDLRRSLARFPELAGRASCLLDQYPPPTTGCHRLHLRQKLQLDLIFGDIGEQMLAHGEGLRDRVHAWYLDGFSPEVNPAMWLRALCGLIADSGRQRSTISTYSAAGAVRRGLQDAGYAVKRVRGLAGKRHMLRGVLRKTAPTPADSFRFSAWLRYQGSRLGPLLQAAAIRGPENPDKLYVSSTAITPIRRGMLRAASRISDFSPERFHGHRLPGWSNLGHVSADIDGSVFQNAPKWFRYPSRVAPGSRIAVIGAGVAGSSTARQLARRAWKVSVFERADDLAHGINSLGQLALHCRVFGQDSPLARFFLLGFLKSAREFRELNRNKGFGWHECGLAQLPRPRDLKRKLEPAALAERYPDEVWQWLSRERLRDLTGLPVAGAGWFSPSAGWLDPLELCRLWLDHSGIELHGGTGVDTLRRDGDGWRLLANGRTASSEAFAAVVIACGADAKGFEQLRELPLRQVAGEVVSIPENPASSGIRHIIRGDRGIFPAAGGRHVVAASFAKSANDMAGKPADSLKLVEKMFETAPGFSSEEHLRAGAARCQSSDFAPIVGAAPDVAECRKNYACLSRNARAGIHRPPAHLPGLYVNLAHGSHGLCSAPLAADYLASLIQGEAPPLDRGMAAAIDPLRFLIRDLRRRGSA